MKARRFLWVISPKGKAHIKYGGRSEGPVKCGAYAAPGWKWRRAYLVRDVPVCEHCAKPKL
jgi:hypothetical protein